MAHREFNKKSKWSRATDPDFQLRSPEAASRSRASVPRRASASPEPKSAVFLSVSAPGSALPSPGPKNRITIPTFDIHNEGALNKKGFTFSKRFKQFSKRFKKNCHPQRRFHSRAVLLPA